MDARGPGLPSKGNDSMRIRSVYYKVSDMTSAIRFWKEFLQQELVSQGENWSSFDIDGVKLGLLLNDFGDDFTGSGCVPTLEVDSATMDRQVALAKSLGATVVLDGLADPEMRNIVLRAPGGHEFELSIAGAFD